MLSSNLAISSRGLLLFLCNAGLLASLLLHATEPDERARTWGAAWWIDPGNFNDLLYSHAETASTMCYEIQLVHMSCVFLAGNFCPCWWIDGSWFFEGSFRFYSHPMSHRICTVQIVIVHMSCAFQLASWTVSHVIDMAACSLEVLLPYWPTSARAGGLMVAGFFFEGSCFFFPLTLSAFMRLWLFSLCIF